MQYTPASLVTLGLNSCEITEITSRLGIPSNDIHGIMFFQRRDMIEDFSRRLTKHEINFNLYGFDARLLAERVKTSTWLFEYQVFDRIDVSNIADYPFLGLKKTLVSMPPILEPVTDNPFATLLTTFINAIAGLQARQPRKFAARIRALTELVLPNPIKATSNSNPDDLFPLEKANYFKVAETFPDNDPLWTTYGFKEDFAGAARAAGLEEQINNPIISKWPWRINTSKSTEDIKKAYKLMPSSGTIGSERFVEWKRI